MLRAVYEPLLRRDATTLRPTPALAAVERTGPTSWIVRLRDGSRFADGAPLDARAVKANFDRILDPAAQARLRDTFASLIGDVSVADDRTVRIETRIPYAPLPERLATLGIASLDGPAPAAGTGPYRLAGSPGEGTHVLERNDRYRGGPPAFRRVTYRHVPDGAAATRALRDGEADVATGLPLGAADLAGGETTIVRRPAPNVLELRMDALGRGGPTPFTDRRVRKAVAHAVDVRRIAREILAGHAEPVATSVVASMFGHDESVRPYAFDRARARQLLAEAGHAGGFDTVFKWLPASLWPNTKAIVEAIARDLDAVGIRAELVSVTAKEMSALTRSGRAGPLFIRNDPNGGSYDGSYAFFYLRSRYPYAYYWSDELETLIVQAESAMQPETRREALLRAQRLLHEESPYVWLFSGFVLAGARPGIDLTDAFVGAELRPDGVRRSGT